MARSNLPDAVISEIYDSALDPAGLARLSTLVTGYGEGSSAFVSVVDGDGGMEAATHALPEDTPDRYAGHYHSVNPLFPLVMAEGLSLRPISALDYVPDLAFKQTEFYYDFARHFDAFQMIGGFLPIAPGRIAQVCINRGERERRFDERDIARAARLFPHVQSALRLRLRLAVSEARLGFAALEALAIGCVICDRAARTLYANAAAEALAIDAGLRLAGQDTIRMHRPEDSSRLLALVADAAAGGPGGALALTGNGDARLFLLVAPLAPQFGLGPGHALVTMRSADPATSLDPCALHDIFGLTPAEARLALALLAGRSLVDFGAARGITENTMRTQLAAILRKTDTSGQRDLVRLLAAMPPLRRPQ